jgi:hypothetical protein
MPITVKLFSSRTEIRRLKIFGNVNKTGSELDFKSMERLKAQVGGNACEIAVMSRGCSSRGE